MPLVLQKLHGPPQVGSYVAPYCVDTDHVDGQTSEENLDKVMEDGTFVLVEQRVRIRWTLGWKHLSTAEMEAIVAEVEGVIFEFTPRTVKAAAGDTGPAPTFTVRRTSPIVVTRRLDLEGPQDKGWDLTLACETVSLVSLA